jgi:hypothetical protein
MTLDTEDTLRNMRPDAPHPKRSKLQVSTWRIRFTTSTTAQVAACDSRTRTCRCTSSPQLKHLPKTSTVDLVMVNQRTPRVQDGNLARLNYCGVTPGEASLLLGCRTYDPAIPHEAIGYDTLGRICPPSTRTIFRRVITFQELQLEPE